MQTLNYLSKCDKNPAGNIAGLDIDHGHFNMFVKKCFIDYGYNKI